MTTPTVTPPPRPLVALRALRATSTPAAHRLAVVRSITVDALIAEGEAQGEVEAHLGQAWEEADDQRRATCRRAHPELRDALRALQGQIEEGEERVRGERHAQQVQRQNLTAQRFVALNELGRAQDSIVTLRDLQRWFPDELTRRQLREAQARLILARDRVTLIGRELEALGPDPAIAQRIADAAVVADAMIAAAAVARA